MDLTRATSQELRNLADHLRQELTEVDIQMIDLRKQRFAIDARINEIYAKLRLSLMHVA